MVRGEGAVQVYVAPDFDSKVIGRLKPGTRVRVSRQTTGKFYKFHKVVMGRRVGYIADNEVAIGNRAVASTTSSDRPRKRRETKPVYFSRFVGVLVGTTELKEGITGVDASDQLLIYGLKITGPDVLMGTPMDLNFALHYGAPKYYDKLSSVRPAGFILYTDALLLLPWLQRQNFAGLFGVGPLLVYSDFQVVNGGRAQSLSTLNIGASFMAGVVYRFSRVGLRLEGKYFLEKQSAKAIQVGLQTEW